MPPPRSSCWLPPSPPRPSGSTVLSRATTSNSTLSPGSTRNKAGCTESLIRTGPSAPTSAPANPASSSTHPSPGCSAQRLAWSCHGAWFLSRLRFCFSRPPVWPPAPSHAFIFPTPLQPWPDAPLSSPATRSSPPTTAPHSLNSRAASGFRCCCSSPCANAKRLLRICAAPSTAPRFPSRSFSPAAGSPTRRSASWPAICLQR